MSATYKFTYSSNIIEEPFTIENSISYSLVIENIGDETGSDLGFYINVPTNLGSIEYPSTDSPSQNYLDLISIGNDGYGLTITQNSNVERIMLNNGDSEPTKIPLILGTTVADELEVGESITITLDLTFPPSYPSKTFYIDLILG